MQCRSQEALTIFDVIRVSFANQRLATILCHVLTRISSTYPLFYSPPASTPTNILPPGLTCNFHQGLALLYYSHQVIPPHRYPVKLAHHAKPASITTSSPAPPRYHITTFRLPSTAKSSLAIPQKCTVRGYICIDCSRIF